MQTQNHAKSHQAVLAAAALLFAALAEYRGISIGGGLP